METLLGRAGDTGLADDKDPAAFGVSSPDTSPAADPESDCKTGPDPDDVSRSSSTPSSPLQQNKRKSDDRRGSVGESPDDVTDAGSRSLAERRARRHEECRAKTKEMEVRSASFWLRLDFLEVRRLPSGFPSHCRQQTR